MALIYVESVVINLSGVAVLRRRPRDPEERHQAIAVYFRNGESVELILKPEEAEELMRQARVLYELERTTHFPGL